MFLCIAAVVYMFINTSHMTKALQLHILGEALQVTSCLHNQQTNLFVTLITTKTVDTAI